jgi:serine/threonine protein phosphatase PrpC
MHRSPRAGPDRRPAEGDIARNFAQSGLRILVAGGTRIGHRYPANFDVLHVDRGLPFVAVADGMGGGAGSAVAGSTTMSTFVGAVRAAGGAVGPARLRAAVAEAQSRVHSAGARLGELTGCTLTAMITEPSTAATPTTATPTVGPPDGGTGGPPDGPHWNTPTTRLDLTTLAWNAPTAIFSRPGRNAGPGYGAGGPGYGASSPGANPGPGSIVGPTSQAADGPRPLEGWIVQIGDSRAYRLRDGHLELLTIDHTEAWLGTLNGWYPAGSPEAAAARYQLTRYVGHPDLPEPDLLNVSVLPGDVYCLCTDGVTDELDYHLLADRLRSDSDPIKIVHRLLTDALAAGGRDNATLAVLCVEAA